MVQLFISLGMSELDAFRAYADIYPDDCTLLVDTIDTLASGIPNAIKTLRSCAGKVTTRGRALGFGDLAIRCISRIQLGAAGFNDVSIMLSNNLDELVIWQVITQIAQEAPRYGVDADQLIIRLVYGVGTRLITSWGEPALGGVYKLVAVVTRGYGARHKDLRSLPNPQSGDKRV
jgi:nicotinate phosphoribosyltransferase